MEIEFIIKSFRLRNVRKCRGCKGKIKLSTKASLGTLKLNTKLAEVIAYPRPMLNLSGSVKVIIQNNRYVIKNVFILDI